jgi:hypothetical protein
MVNALLMVAAAGFGFGGSPWIGFAIGAPMAVLLSIPEQLDVLTRYRGQPKTDIVMVILLYLGMAIAGALACAWLGYFLAFLFRP